MMPLVPRRSSTRAGLVLLLVLLVLVVGSVSYLGWRQSVPGPRVRLSAPRVVGHRASIAVGVEAVRGTVARLEVRAVQDGRTATLAVRERLGPRADVELVLEPGAAGLREGAAVLEVRAADDFWRPLRPGERAAAAASVTVDLTPPRLEVVGATPYVAPGGAGVVVVRAEGAARVETRVAALAFPTFALGPDATRVGFFALPWDYAGGTPLVVTAQDEAGNAATRPVPVTLLPRRFRHEQIDLTDAFLQAKVPELLPQHPPTRPLIDGFLVINRDQRRQAEEEKRRIAARTADRPLWEGPFLEPRNAKVFANFAETRSYRYQGREVDTQVHFGYDLASVRQAPVPAANAGVVVFAGPLTIYGNTVIVDHGLGLMTLYAHLSTVAVKVGDAVTRGQELGRTGATGLATGDHLHYEVLVHGVSVTPLEWWDARWIRDRILGPLQAAGVPFPGLPAR